MIAPERCQEIFGRVQTAALSLGVRDVEASIDVSDQSLTRFANNAIHQNVAERSHHLSVRVLLDGRTARASVNRFDGQAVRGVVEDAVALARLQPHDPDLPPLAGPASWTPVARRFAATADATASDRAEAVREAIGAVEGAGQTAAGIYSTSESFSAVLNSRGVFAWHPETMAVFSITAMADDSSGWAKASDPDAARLRSAELARSAMEKARASAAPVEIEPGPYTVILEPAAVLDVVGQMFPDFSGTALHEERSFLNGRLGETLFGPNIHIVDDAFHPLQAGPPFDGEGVPRRRLTMIEGGVAREVAWGRQAARIAGVEPTGHGFPAPSEVGEAPLNIVIAGGDTSVEAMIASTARGILVTRLWYIREVDPSEKIMTGMTRDGTFLIENGRLTRGVRNFRFNQSIIEMLRNVEAMSPPVRASGEETFDAVVPAMKAREFRFTETTRF